MVSVVSFHGFRLMANRLLYDLEGVVRGEKIKY